jgi:hypothetical protein
MFGLLLVLGAAPAMAANPPTLFTLAAGTPKILAQGAQKSWPVKINEDQAFDAIFKGGMWLPNPAGGRIYAKYQRHILHDNGTWTWIGTVSTVHGDQSVVLTFGKGVVFGLVPQASGYPLRIVTRAGETRVVETSAAMSRSKEQLRLHSKPDYFVPPRPGSKAGANTLSPQPAASVPVQAAASGPVTIDVMVAYTPGFVSELGSQRAALTRIQNLVDTTNQAYTASGVNQQIRLVNTVEVNYPDNTSNNSALDDITGIDENGNPVPIPASLQGIASLRTQYGADLVALIRSYDNATQGNCGIGWLIGGDQAQIVPSESNVYGYSVVSDGSNGGYYCLDTTFAHELGHNMGDAHDRANATESGAYSYSYGYLGNGTHGFSTIMAYGTDTSTPLSLFSNPNISACQSTPCGVADSASNSADNAHSMNNTASLIAAFEPTVVLGPPPSAFSGQFPAADINGDGKDDLLWRQLVPGSFADWQMNGSTVLSMSKGFSADSSFTLVAAGKFYGPGKPDDLVWANSGSIWMWVPSGSTFVSRRIDNMPAGWMIIGSGDVDGDGKADLIFRNVSGGIAYWRMNGSTVTYRSRMFSMSPSYREAAIGDFNGDGRADILWTDETSLVLWQSTGSGFTQQSVGDYPAGWQLLGCGDVNGDGKCDLVWYNSTSGAIAFWLMNGSSVTYRSRTIPPPPGYAPVTIADFNGDGKVDIVWSNDYSLVMWLGNGNGFGAATTFSSYPAGWSVAPPPPGN